MNDNEIAGEPTKLDSTAAKGMAVLAMVFLHLFCRIDNLPYTPLLMLGKTPLIYYFGLFGDICVPIYCFISGYAQYLLNDNSNSGMFRKSIKRLGLLWLNYAVVLSLFSIIGLIVGSNTIPGSVMSFIGNLFVVGMSYNGAWRFVITYALLVILSPLFIKAVKKLNPIFLLTLSGAVYFIAYIFRFVFTPYLPGKLLPWLFTQAVLVGTSQFSFVTGMLFRNYGLIGKLRLSLKKKHLLVPFCITVPSALFFIHCFEQSAIVAPINGIATLVCFYLFPFHSRVEKAFHFLGKHSTNIWLSHMFFYTAPLSGLVFRAKYPVAVLGFTLILSVIFSYLESGIVTLAKTLIGYRFDLGKVIWDINNRIYVFLLRKRINVDNTTIICNNCIGGIIYHNLGWQFTSPTINLSIHGEDYLLFVKNLRYYLTCEIEEVKDYSVKYPVGRLVSNDSELPSLTIHFNHYPSFEAAKKKWIERSSRVNYDNTVFIWEFFDEFYDVELVKEFDKLPIKKAILIHNDIDGLDNAIKMALPPPEIPKRGN